VVSKEYAIDLHCTFVIQRGREIIKVWIDMRASVDDGRIYFWVNYPFKHYLLKMKSLLCFM